MKQKMKKGKSLQSKRGTVGIGAVIVSIAFVVVATSFSFMVIRREYGLQRKHLYYSTFITYLIRF